jgi:predicted GTPase
VIYAGVDYEAILREAEKEADVILWDGGNNDFSFYVPDLQITVADPLRAGNEVSFYPGEVSLPVADIVIINKIYSASAEQIQIVRENITRTNPKACVIDAASPISVDHPERIRGKRVLCVEDGPTLTHGMMKYGAGIVAARKFQARDIIDPRPYITGELVQTFATYPEIGTLLPAMGYSEIQKKDLENTINSADCDTVVIATPIDLNRIIHIKKPTAKVEYELQEIGTPNLEEILNNFCSRHAL